MRELPRGVRAELRGLPSELAEIVGGHLVMAGQLIDDDPTLAFAHAEAARRRASRLPIAREASAETAYAAGEYAHALNEFRALRRMTGSAEYLPVMADCERALGRPQAALKLAREAADANLPTATQVEMIIVESGARADLGQTDEAQRLLRAAISQLGRHPADPAARLRYAYAELLLTADQPVEAKRLFAEAAELDTDGETDAAERVDALDGLVIEFDDSDDEESDVGHDSHDGHDIHDEHEHDAAADEADALGEEWEAAADEAQARADQHEAALDEAAARADEREVAAAADERAVEESAVAEANGDDSDLDRR